jgi:transcriptional regulator with XRE-family HTH domain
MSAANSEATRRVWAARVLQRDDAHAVALARVRAGMTQQQLADAAQCSSKTVGQVERRESSGRTSAPRIAAALGRDIAVLFGGDK